jgi:hypothetical protein
MKLNIPKSFDVGFVILSPEPNIGRLKSTIRSIDRNYGKNTPRICAVAKKTPPSIINEMKTVCPTIRGGDTITSLINTGIKKGHKIWNIMVIEGVCVRPGLHSKYANFCTDRKDVFFPIVPDYDRNDMPVRLNNNFVTATLNGLCIHQDTFKEVGNFSDEDSINLTKLKWALNAQDCGCRFKAILGARIC